MPRTAVLPAGIDAAGLRLLNDWQRGFPLESRPFAMLGNELGLAEQQVIDAYRCWLASGVVSRIGAVFAPLRLGAGALVAMAVPPDRLATVAARVSAEPGVNHNYEREHRLNLWFVVTAASPDLLERSVERIERETGCPALVLPLLDEYHIDLGFDLTAAPGVSAGGRVAAAALASRAARVSPACVAPAHVSPACATGGGALAPAAPGAIGARPVSALDRRVLGALQDGLPLEARPYAELGRRSGSSEGVVMQTIAAALADGLIRRFGVVVRHHELGIDANAMCVWDVPDESAGEIGRRLAAEPVVTLCYRRRRAPPQWRYNLYCMIHGSARESVRAARDELAARLGLDAWPHAVLFSGRRFKQGGARYLPELDNA